MEEKPRRPARSSIDGFITPQKKPQIPRIQPEETAPEVKQPVATKEPEPKPQEPVRVETAEPKDFNPYYSPYSSKKNKKRPHIKKKWSRKRKVLTSILVVVLILLGIGGWYGASIIHSLDKAFHGNVFSDVHAIFSSTTLKGEATGRVNILLAGDSTDDPGHQGADLTDSIMILSIDTKNHTGFMLSVPRDLWVDIPGVGHQKINAANTVSNFSEPGYPKGGMGQLQEIVQTDLGIPIDYYALINYQAFKQSVDAVDGIKIYIQSSDPRGLYDAYTHLKLPNGWVTLDGQQALDLARARGDDAAGDISYGFPNSDFDRTEHQRQMLVALAKKAKTAGVITNPIKVSQLVSAFGDNIETNLTLQDMLRLAQITKGVNLSSLQSLTYQYGGTNSLLTGYESSGGQDALIPSEGLDEFGALKQYYKQISSDNPVVREAPTAVVLNGTDTDGLAKKEEGILTSDGFNVLYAGDAVGNYNSSMIVNLAGTQKPAATTLLKTLFPKDTTMTNSASGSTEATEASGYTANYVIILGQDSSNIQEP